MKVLLSFLLVIVDFVVISTSADPGVCNAAPSKPGMCRAYFPSYTFANNECQFFVYGGCGATANIFRSKEECEAKCLGVVTKAPPAEKTTVLTTTKKSALNSVCNAAPSKSGMCQAYFPSYTFANNECQFFVYGGCGATANIFRSKEECEAKCLGVVTKAPPAKKTTILTTTKKSVLTSVCNAAPSKPGMCRAYFPSYTFANNECQFFVYGGCGASENIFRSKEECETKCLGGGSATKSLPTVETTTMKPTANSECYATPSKTGFCKAYIPSYTFRNNKCEYFVYGGCGATKNIFRSQKECETKCAGGVTMTKVPATTTQKAATDTAGPCDDTPSVTGICEAHTYAVTFRDGQCQQFIYGGCGATKNYFSSKAECEKLCLQA